MASPSHYSLILIAGALGVCGLCWRASITLSSPSVLAKASISVDLSLPSSTLLSNRLFSNATNQQSITSTGSAKKRNHGPVSRFMMELYNRRPNADIVRAFKPLRVSSAKAAGSGRLVEFEVPPARPEEALESAELLGPLGTIQRVVSIDQQFQSIVRDSRRDDNWRAFDVTQAVKGRTRKIVKLLVRGRVGKDESFLPILVMSYAKPRVRKTRATHEEDHEEGAPWIEEGGRRQRRRNLCRRRPLYVDFASIAYDEWVVAPPGYEAYQCVGKCFYPFGDHLSPTKHAIVQTLVHGAIQNADGVNTKPVGRACCVPTRLAPTSLLYIDASGTLTYQYGYEDMVVAECGCR